MQSLIVILSLLVTTLGFASLPDMPITNTFAYDVYDFIYDYDDSSYEDFSIRNPWPYTDLTVYIDISTIPQRLDNIKAVKTIKQSFNPWAKESALQFTFIDDSKDADIRISFEKFDGNNKTALGRGWFPPVGTIKLNADKPWNIDQHIFGSTVDLFTVMLHEIGHVIGIKHSDAKEATMYYSYQGKKLALDQDDINAVQHLYPKHTNTEVEENASRNTLNFNPY